MNFTKGDFSRHTKKDGFTVNAYGGRLLGLVRELRGRTDYYRSNLMIPSEGRDQLIAQERNAAMDALKVLRLRTEAAFASQKEKLRTKAADSFYVGKTTADVAKEEQQARRIRGLLNAGVSAEDIAGDAAQAGDLRTLSVLEAEYPAYQWERTGSKPPSEEIHSLMGPAKYEAGDDAYRNAMDALEETEAAHYTAQVNLAQASQEIEQGERMVGFIAADGSVQDVSGDDTK